MRGTEGRDSEGQLDDAAFLTKKNFSLRGRCLLSAGAGELQVIINRIHLHFNWLIQLVETRWFYFLLDHFSEECLCHLDQSYKSANQNANEFGCFNSRIVTKDHFSKE